MRKDQRDPWPVTPRQEALCFAVLFAVGAVIIVIDAVVRAL